MSWLAVASGRGEGTAGLPSSGAELGDRVLQALRGSSLPLVPGRSLGSLWINVLLEGGPCHILVLPCPSCGAWPFLLAGSEKWLVGQRPCGVGLASAPLSSGSWTSLVSRNRPVETPPPGEAVGVVLRRPQHSALEERAGPRGLRGREGRRMQSTAVICRPLRSLPTGRMGPAAEHE